MLDAKSLALPLHPGMDEDDVRRVAKELRNSSPSWAPDQDVQR